MITSVGFFFFQAEDGIRDDLVTGVQTCALPISSISDLAKQIVSLAEGAPIEPSEVLDIDEMQSRFRAPPPLPIFVIQAIAPSAETAPAGRARSYGADSTQWRPFAGQRLPLAEYARQVAERFDFDAQVIGIERGPEVH